MWCCPCLSWCRVPSNADFHDHFEKKAFLNTPDKPQPIIISPQSPVEELVVDSTKVDNLPPQENRTSNSSNKYYLQYDFGILKKGCLVEEVEAEETQRPGQIIEWIRVRNADGNIVKVPLSYMAKIRDIDEEPWYFPNINSREDAKFRLLKAAPEDGIYMVRQCPDGSSAYVLSVKRSLQDENDDGKAFQVEHYQISENNGLFGEEGNEVFVTLPAMIDYYISIGCISKPCLKESVIEIDPSEIKRHKEIGVGAYGVVYRATWRGRTVAVKEMRKIADFKAEIELIAQFHHPKIVCMHGANLSTSPHFMVMEFMCNDSLKNYVHNNDLKLEQNLYILEQIADGMRYLAKFQVLHRDLAARNILVGSDLCVKISDFGLSRRCIEMTEGETKKMDPIYYMSFGYLVPILWLSVESLTRGKFTVKSDVWMFGILAMEVFTKARPPYAEFRATNQEVATLIQCGKRMSRPDTMPEDVYKKLDSCWKEDPHERPTFEDLYMFFSGAEKKKL